MQRNRPEKKKKVDGSRLKIAIVVSRFHSDITGAMLEGALAVLKKSGVKKNNIRVVHVPGSFEIPLACERLARTKRYDGIVALGCIIKGETDHDVYIAKAVSKGIMDVMLQHAIPIGFGVLTTNNLAQARARSTGKNNKGIEAAQAVLIMADRK